MPSKTLTKLAASNRDKVASVDDDTDIGDGYWLNLTRGWCYPEQGSHLIHEDTVADTLAAFRAIEPCRCPECTYHRPDFN